jgi:TetR/AcrR family transcriptional repressor of lmrAB and yxaGH operons
MLETAADLLRRQGYAATGWRQIVAESGTPWGSQSHHFPGGKEQLAAEALTEASREYEKLLRAAFGRMHPADAVLGWSKAAVVVLEESDWSDGCPMATVALERAHTSDELAAVCNAAFINWQRALAEAMTSRGVASGEARRLATFVLASIEGALLLARTRRSAEPLRTVARELADLLRARVPV